jgi:hypothetical protein
MMHAYFLFGLNLSVVGFFVLEQCRSRQLAVDIIKGSVALCSYFISANFNPSMYVL